MEDGVARGRTRWLFLAAIIPGLICFSGVRPALADPPWFEKILAGENAFHANDPKAALELCREASKLGPPSDEQGVVFFCIGSSLKALGEDKGALENLRKAVDLIPKDPYLSKETLPDARIELSVAATNLGHLDEAQSQLDASVKEFESLGILSPVRRARSLLIGGRIRKARNDFAGAKKLFSQGLQAADEIAESNHCSLGFDFRLELADAKCREDDFAGCELSARAAIAEVDRCPKVGSGGLAGALAVQAAALAGLGNLTGAEASARRALQVAGKTMNPTTAAAKLTLGMAAFQRGDKEEARALIAEAIAYRKTALGSDSVEVAHATLCLGDRELNGGSLERADTLVTESLRTLTTKLGKGDPLVAIASRLLGEIRFVQGRLTEARPLLQAATSQRPDTLEYAKAAYAMGMLELADRNCTASSAWFERSLATYSQRFGSYPSIPAVNVALAAAKSCAGDDAAAISAAQQALTLTLRLQPDDKEAAAIRKVQLGGYLLVVGRVADAAKEIEIGSASLVHGTSTTAVWATHELAMLRLEQGSYKESERLLRQDLAVPSLAPRDAASLQNSLGIVLAALGHLPEAHAQIGQASAFLDQSSDRLNAAIVSGNLGLILLERGELDSAAPMLRASVATLEQKLGKDSLKLYPYLLGLGCVAHSKGDEKGAERHFLRALRIAEQEARNTRYEADALLAVASTEIAQGRSWVPLALAARGSALSLRVRGPRHPEIGGTLSAVGSLALQRGDSAAGRTLLVASIAQFDVTLGNGNLRSAEVFLRLARLDLDGKRLKAAEASARTAVASRSAKLGDSLETAEALRLLAEILRARGSEREADEYEKRAARMNH